MYPKVGYFRLCGDSNGMAAGLLASVIPNSMSDMVESERCIVTIKNGSPPNVRRCTFFVFSLHVVLVAFRLQYPLAVPFRDICSPSSLL